MIIIALVLICLAFIVGYYLGKRNARKLEVWYVKPSGLYRRNYNGRNNRMDH